MHVLVTGAAGYLGSMLVEILMRLPGTDLVVGVDLKAEPKRHLRDARLRWIQSDVADDDWIEALDDTPVDVIVHCAYQSRALYDTAGRERLRRGNLDGGRKVFAFAFARRSVHRLIHLSTVSAYGARPENSAEVALTEDAPLAEDLYPYAIEKVTLERELWALYQASDRSTHVVVLRPSSISGPYGHDALARYGLISTLVGRFPAVLLGRPDWCRQYLHEDDAQDILAMLVQAAPRHGFEVFNASPEDCLTARDLARLFDKRLVAISPNMIRLLFALLWHGTRGAVATPAGAWKFLSYPIRTDGSRLTRTYGHVYRYSSADALMARKGRYATCDPFTPAPRAHVCSEEEFSSPGEPQPKA